MTIFNLGYGGGGGGGGAGSGSGGAGGSASITGLPGETVTNYQGRAGSGGSGVRGGYKGYNGDMTIDTIGTAGWGGAGGGFGSPGFPGNPAHAGTTSSTRGLGGAGGDSINGGANITWKAYGTICGDLDSWGTWGGTGANNSALMSTHISSTKDSLMNGNWIMGLGGSGNGELGDGQLGDRWWWHISNAGIVDVPSGNFTFAFIYANTTGANIIAHLYGSIDNQLTSMTVNGVSVTPGTLMPFNTIGTTNNFTLVPGCNVIKVVATNTAASAAGINLRIRRTSDNFVLAGPEGWFF